MAGFIGKLFAKRHIESLAYFKENPPRVGWEFVFVCGHDRRRRHRRRSPGGEFVNEWIPPMWEARFGDSIALRASVAFGGGILMAFGARLAGGCTSGHGISGTMQLNVASWIAVDLLLHRRHRGRHAALQTLRHHD